MSNLKKTEQELPEPSIFSKLEAEEEPKKGDYFADDRAEEVFRLLDFTLYEKKYRHWSFEVLVSVSPLQWRKADRTISDSSLKQYYRKIEESYFKEGHELYLSFLKTSDLSMFELSSESKVGETDLVAPGSKQQLEGMQAGLALQAKRVEALRLFVTQQLELEKQKLKGIRAVLQGKIQAFKREMKKIYRVIQTIELYLGIDEELVQIQEGAAASAEEPICFRQQMLFMDEEVGAYEEGGLDINDIPVFEEWLLKEKNYEKLLPEKKGVVVFKPRRWRKEYGNAREDAQMDFWNRRTYLLIRNGENIYRIDSENLSVSERLFPQREELAKIIADSKNKEKFEDKFDEYRRLAFLMQGLIDRTEVFSPLPGRVSIFNMDATPEAIRFIYDDENLLPTGRLSFWDWHRSINEGITRGSRVLLSGNYSDTPGRYVSAKDYKDRLYYYCNDYNVPGLPRAGVYEVEEKFVDRYVDALPHYEWDRLEKLGLVIKKGERVFRLCEGWEKHDYNPKPEPGVEIKLSKNPEEKREQLYIEAYSGRIKSSTLCIKYNPGGEASQGWGKEWKERTRNISWKIEKRDRFVLHYDRISLEDIDFYISSRTDRKHYFYLMPLLKGIRKRLLEEKKNEDEFVRFLVGRIAAKMPEVSEQRAEQFCRELLDWWKFRTLQKRPISKDDTLAMRMIEKRLTAAVNRKKLTNDA